MHVPSPPGPGSIGATRDDADLLDEITKDITESRRTRTLRLRRMNKALLDTDIYSEILRGDNATVTAHARTYRQAHGRLTLSVITVMEMVKGL